ncbi:MarR family winged helix-turn-helix transcriptional regulator [Pseudonocardia humida]|uniref:Winged helix-turn-helix transcriptional regulator n=1 Tax=Pseudonocardia humida TaxID=2800819 RepID=A0ABT1A260_9PSEU|nr:MarR family winged helix-turn-helix transcriptional regulator [Pseudonocardia humida]MCO1657018.1 winged helix-turn-helix transcriptional regulator [Pseudonocardia humida]
MAEDESLPELFRLVNRRLRQLARESLDPWDVTPGQSRALGVLLRGGPLRLSELAERLRIVPRSTTEVVDALQAAGLVERRPDPHDRRAVLVALTDHGSRVGEAVRAARAAEAERFFGALDEPDRVELARILRALVG